MNNKTKNLIILLLIILLASSIYLLSKKNNSVNLDKPGNNNQNSSNNNIDESPKDEENNPIEDTNENPEAIITQGEIKEFDLEIDFASQDKDIDIEYEVKTNNISAKVDDEINKVYLTGDKAKNYIEDNFFNINYNNPESEVIDKVLQILSINEDFTEFKLEVDYFDGNSNKIKIVQ